MNTQETQQVMESVVSEMEFESLESIAINQHGSTIYRVGGEALPYAFFLKNPVAGKPLVIFGQGDQNRKTVTLPRFQRMDWAQKLDYNVLIFSDPTLHLSPETGLGWLLGTKDHYVLEHVKEVIEKIRDHLKLNNRNLLFYGSSAGGFTSLMLASYFDGASALVNNPQTDVLKFTMGGVQNLLKLGFGGVTREEARELYGPRMSFIERIKNGSAIPNIYYLQNLLDLHHHQDHMLPLVNALHARCAADQITDHRSRLIFDLYSDSKAKHNPVGLGKIQSCISSIQHWLE